VIGTPLTQNPVTQTKLLSAAAARARAGGLVVAGGDTSSAIVRALKPRDMEFLGDIDPGVPLCKANFADGRDLPIVLKGGQVGLPDLFDRIASDILRTC
jgi:3-oxoisoapionate kinase